MEIKTTQEVTREQMDNMLVTALEGGINYWCGSAEITKPAQEDTDSPDAKWASHVVSRGGELKMTDVEEPDEVWTLTQEKMLKGMAYGLKWGNYGSVENMLDSHDAETADVIVQYALFDDIVFG
jgi:hypothetical protein